jgi:hypothetical protein
MALSKATRLAWRKFLSSEAGAEGLLYLETNDPVIGSDGDSTKIIFAAGRVQGYKDAIRKIPRLVEIAETLNQEEENN